MCYKFGIQKKIDKQIEQMSSSWWNPFSRNQSKSQTKTQTSMQAQTVDQNYANNTFFMAMSALETYELKLKAARETHKGIKEKYEGQLARQNKEFGQYDKNDYSFKDINELKGQLRNSVMIMAYSKLGFEKTYGQKSFKLPKNYDEAKAVQRIQKFKQYFKSISDQDGFFLADDLERILRGQTTGLYYENMKLVESQSQQSKKDTLKNAIKAADQMREEEQMVANQLGTNMSPTNLQFKINPGYQKFANSSNWKAEQSKQFTKYFQVNENNKIIEINNIAWKTDRTPFSLNQKMEIVFFDNKGRQFYVSDNMQIYFYDENHQKYFFKDQGKKQIINEKGQQFYYNESNQAIQGQGLIWNSHHSKRTDINLVQSYQNITFTHEQLKKIQFVYQKNKQSIQKIKPPMAS